MLSKPWSAQINGNTYSFQPTGRTLYYGKNHCQEVNYMREEGDVGYPGPTMFVSVRATRAEVEQRLSVRYRDDDRY